MATLTLVSLFINRVSTGEAVSGRSARGRPEDYSSPGEVRTYAGGRRRSITAAGEAGTYKFTLLLVPRTTVETLRAWQGELVQVRDNKGRRFFGVYHGVSIVEIISRATWHVSIELSVVTATEAV